MNAGNRGVSDPPTGLIRYWAAARAAAGCSEELYAAQTLEQALAAATALHGPGLARVLARCAFVVDGTPVSRRDPATVPLSDGGTIEVLPPFAGGADAGPQPLDPATGPSYWAQPLSRSVVPAAVRRGAGHGEMGR